LAARYQSLGQAMSDRALFTLAPLVCLVAVVVGATLRIQQESARPSAARAAARRQTVMRLLPAIALLGVLLGHVVLFGWPNEVLRWSRDLSRLMATELALLALGVAALVGVADAARRLLQRTDGSARLVDAAWLGVLLLTLISGLGVAVLYRWAAAWSAVTVARYVRALVSLQPNLEPLAAMPYLVKLHIFASFVLVALMAFTRFIDVPLRALLRAIHDVIDPLAAALNRRWRPLQHRVLRSSRRLMWSEEDDWS
jgi:nitrate reductase gamma subunit